MFAIGEDDDNDDKEDGAEELALKKTKKKIMHKLKNHHGAQHYYYVGMGEAGHMGEFFEGHVDLHGTHEYVGEVARQAFFDRYQRIASHMFDPDQKISSDPNQLIAPSDEEVRVSEERRERQILPYVLSLLPTSRSSLTSKAPPSLQLSSLIAEHDDEVRGAERGAGVEEEHGCGSVFDGPGIFGAKSSS